MNRQFRTALVFAMVAAIGGPAFGQQRPPPGGRAPAPSGARAPAPVMRAPEPVSRPAAPPPRPAAPPAAQFNFNHDLSARPAAPVQQRPAAPVQQRQVMPPQQQRPEAPPQQRPGAPQPQSFPHASYTNGGGPYYGRFHGPVIRNPHVPPNQWGWNHGVAWVPAPIYWGGGFWGPWALASLSAAILFGSIADYQNQVVYPSYQVEADSTGAQLLQNYGLQQTPCGPPDLVVIWGPNNSVICAYPNATVGAGNYELDPSTLTIVSESPPQ